MANKEAIQFQEALANKIKSWEATEDFANSSTGRQKLNRSLNLLLGSDPETIIDMLGGDFVPDNPRDAMNLIRGLDLKTLKSMEILELTGKGDKLVGHHAIAASTLQNLRHMSPKERLKVYQGLADMGQRYGMDPKQIFLIADKIHESIAHEGDFTGRKTGVNLPYIVGETGDEFLKRFEAPMKQQLAALEQAVAAGETQSYYQAINAVEDQLQIPRGTLVDPNTPLAVRDAATKLLRPTAGQIREVVNAGEDITERTTEILKNTPLRPKALSNFFDLSQASGIIKAVPKVGLAGGLLTAAGIGLDAKAATDITKKGETPMETTANMFEGVSGLTGLAAARPSPLTPILGTISAVTGATAGLARWRINRDKEKARDREIMDPNYEMSPPVYGELKDTNQLRQERRSDQAMLSGSFK